MTPVCLAIPSFFLYSGLVILGVHKKQVRGASVSERTISSIKGVVRAMMWNKLKYMAVAVLVTVGLTGSASASG